MLIQLIIDSTIFKIDDFFVLFLFNRNIAIYS
jgi:hypothetical protein